MRLFATSAAFTAYSLLSIRETKVGLMIIHNGISSDHSVVTH